MSDNSQSGFLGRWSRLKRAQPAGPAVADRKTSEAGLESSLAPDQGEAGEHSSDLEALLPTIDGLTGDSDIRGFLQKGVSEELKRLALRRAWALDPQIRDFIEVAENQYDWNTPGGAPGFGDLLAGTDTQALLAQATGAGTPAEERSGGLGPDVGTAEAAKDRATTGQPDEQVDHVAATDDDQPGDDRAGFHAAGDGPARDAERCPGDVPLAGSSAAQSPARRRKHGSALPV